MSDYLLLALILVAMGLIVKLLYSISKDIEDMMSDLDEILTEYESET